MSADSRLVPTKAQRPSGREADTMAVETQSGGAGSAGNENARYRFGALAVVALLAAPFAVYPVLLMSVLCFALFACAFNLLIGYVGLLSFGMRHSLEAPPT